MAAGDFSVWSSATEQARALREREISVGDLLAIYRDRIERYNPELNAIVVDCLDAAAERAREIDSMPLERRLAPLYGLPMTIKESVEVRGLLTTGGVAEVGERVSKYDAPQVLALLGAGMTLMGKTNVPHSCADWQADSPRYGRTNNPWNLTRSPGGSSGGSAAALAAALTPLELGTDIGGSVRVPACFCGIYGLRPSETAMPRSGDFPGSRLPNPSLVMTVMGPLARSPEDLELALDILAGPVVGEDVAWRLEIREPRHERLADFRVGIVEDLEWAPVSNDVRRSIEDVRRSLVRAGATVETVVSEDLFGGTREHHQLYLRFLTAIMGWDFSPDERDRMIRLVGERRPELLQATRDAFHASPSDFMTWHVRREEQRERFRTFFNTWDILIAPITLGTAFEHQAFGEALFDLYSRDLDVDEDIVPYDLQLVYPALATLSGQPAVAFPTGFSDDGLPIGLQAIGPYLEDRTPIRFAGLLAREIGGFSPPPGYD
jgi:amidase